MLFDLDALKGTARLASVKYRWLAGRFDLDLLPREYAWEIAVLIRTPGIEPEHVQAWMFWKPWTWDKLILPIIQAFEGDATVDAAAQENARSIDAEDARDMLMATYAGRCRGIGTKGPVPIYGTMWLQEKNRSGFSLRMIAEELGVSEVSLERWKHSNGYVSRRWL